MTSDPWKCPNCGEELEETQFECWNCGTARDGEKNPEFDRKLWEREAMGHHVQIADTWVCPKCGSRHPHLVELEPSAAITTEMTRSLQTQATCRSCGFVEVVTTKLGSSLFPFSFF